MCHFWVDRMIEKFNLNWIWSIQSINQHWHFWGTLLLSGVPERHLMGPALHLSACFLCNLSTIIEKCGEQIKHVCVSVFLCCCFFPILFCSFSHANLMSVKCKSKLSEGPTVMKRPTVWEKVLYVWCRLIY